MSAASAFPLDGGCDCRTVRYRMQTTPLIVHCCHCRWCQRETGGSFALNALIEADRVTLLSGEPEVLHTPSESGMGQMIARCPTCRIAVWSNYADMQAAILFADISGFTLLTEHLAERGPTGVETLARILKEYFGQLIDIIHDYGGDVVKFAGDAVIAVWPMLHTISLQGAPGRKLPFPGPTCGSGRCGRPNARSPSGSG